MTTTACTIRDFPEASVTELVGAARDGDRAAFGELVARFESMVYATAMQRLGDHADAQELTQEVFIKALEKLHQLEAPAAFGGWLRSITVRMAINRTARRRATIAVEPATLESSCATREVPLDRLVAAERATQVHDGLDRLAALDRKTLVAFYLRGQSLVEMSERFSAPVGTIKRRLHVARKRLARELESLQLA